MNRRLAVGLTGLLLAAGGVAGAEVLGDRFRLAYDSADEPCLPYRLYAVDLTRQTPQRGELVVFDGGTVTARFGESPSFTKKVAGLPGDKVRVSAEGAWVNDTFVGALSQPVLQRAGLTVAAVAGEWSVPAGKMFVVGTEPRAFDSRYYGMVPLDAVQGIARPLW